MSAPLNNPSPNPDRSVGKSKPPKWRLRYKNYKPIVVGLYGPYPNYVHEDLDNCKWERIQ